MKRIGIGYVRDVVRRAPDTGETGAGASVQAQETFTQSQVEHMIERERLKWEEQQARAVEEARTQEQRLLQMTKQERELAQVQKREEELSRREAEVTRRELRAQAMRTLTEHGLPREMGELLNYTDAKQCEESIRTAEKIFCEAVKKGVEERLRGAWAPKAGVAGTGALDYAQLAAQAFNQGDMAAAAYYTRLEGMKNR